MSAAEVTRDGTGDGDVEMKEEEGARVATSPTMQQSDQDTSSADPASTHTVQPHSGSTEPTGPSSQQAFQSPVPAQEPSAVSLVPPPASANPTRTNSQPPQPNVRPEKPVAHGGPTRLFLNTNVTPHLLEGMKYLAAHEPEKPLSWLANFLKEKSREVEGS